MVRVEIASFSEPTGLLAQRHGVSTETVRKWRKRGAEDCLDHSARPHRLPWKATDEERAIVCAVRRARNFPLDDLTFVVSHFLPHLNRHSIWRILKTEGLNRRMRPVAERAAKGQGTFKDHDLGLVHIDITHLPPQPFHPPRGWNLGLLRPSCKPPTASAASASFSSPSTAAHALSTWLSRTTKPRKAPSPSCVRPLRRFPFSLTHVLTDNGSCFTPAFAKTCADLGAQYSHTKPRTPQTGMVERFNGRIGSEVLDINITSRRALEQLLRGFNAAYNTRRQRVLDSKTPDQIVAERLEATPTLAKAKPQGRAGPCDATNARLIAEAAKEVSQPNNSLSRELEEARTRPLEEPSPTIPVTVKMV